MHVPRAPGAPGLAHGLATHKPDLTEVLVGPGYVKKNSQGFSHCNQLAKASLQSSRWGGPRARCQVGCHKIPGFTAALPSAPGWGFSVGSSGGTSGSPPWGTGARVTTPRGLAPAHGWPPSAATEEGYRSSHGAEVLISLTFREPSQRASGMRKWGFWSVNFQSGKPMA